jgi:hypothetical protein
LREYLEKNKSTDPFSSIEKRFFAYSYLPYGFIEFNHLNPLEKMVRFKINNQTNDTKKEFATLISQSTSNVILNTLLNNCSLCFPLQKKLVKKIIETNFLSLKNLHKLISSSSHKWKMIKLLKIPLLKAHIRNLIELSKSACLLGIIESPAIISALLSLYLFSHPAALGALAIPLLLWNGFLIGKLINIGLPEAYRYCFTPCYALLF